MKNPRKRLTSTFFMARYRHFLIDGGIIHLKTDSNFLFTYTSYMVEKNRLPLLFKTEDLYHLGNPRQDLGDPRENLGDPRIDLGSPSEISGEISPELLSIQTYYESMWIARGLNIKYMKWQLPREGALTEPDVEIELDDYRSYHRTKRSSLDKAK